MGEIEKVNPFICDLISIHGKMYVNPNRIKIDDGFTTFVKYYDKELSEHIKDEEIDEVKNEMKVIINLVKNIIKYPITSSSVDQKNKKNFSKSLTKLIKTSKKIKIQKQMEKDLRLYTPKKMLPLIILIEESKLFELMKKKSKKRRRFRK
jgi:hypothetical protein